MAPCVTWRSLVVCCVLWAGGVLVSGRDLYDVLQVTRGANDQQLKRSYRKLALLYHPDKVTGTDEEKKAASKKFAEINHAYEVLSDAEKRRIYDRHGEEGLRQHEGQQAQGQRGGGSIFDMFFGGGFGGGGGEEEEQTPKGHDIYIDLYLTLEDLYVGKELKVVRDKAVIKPAPGKRRCKCKQKLVTRQLGPGMFQQYTSTECEECDNVKLEREQEIITVVVSPGMQEQQQITFFEEGEPMIDGEPGDLKFVVRTAPHALFHRTGHDLALNVTVSLVDALAGFTREITHLDGHQVSLSWPGVTKPGDVRVVKGEGMPHDGNEHLRGDLYVTYSVAFPDQLSEAQKTTIRQLFPAQ